MASLEHIRKNKRKLVEDPERFFRFVTSLTPYPQQKDVLNNFSKRQTTTKGRQVGATTVYSHKMFWRALTAPRASLQNSFTGLIISATQKQAEWALKDPKSNLMNSPLAKHIEHENKKFVRFDNNAEILSLPVGDSGSGIRNLSVDVLYATEAAYIPNEVFKAVEPMTFATNGDIWLESTPNGTSGRFYKSHQDSSFTQFRMPSTKCPGVSSSQLEDFKRGKTEREIKEEIYGEFVSSSDTYLDSKLIQRNFYDGSVKASRVRNNASYVLGVDIARSGEDETAYVILENPPSQDWWQVKNIITKRKKPTTDIMGRIKQLDKIYGFSGVAIDENAVGGGVADVLQEDQVDFEPVTFTQKSKHNMYEALKFALEKEKVKLPNGTALNSTDTQEKMYQQLNQLEYEYSRSGLLKIHHPDGGHDDIPDALALAWKMARENTGSAEGTPFTW